MRLISWPSWLSRHSKALHTAVGYKTGSRLTLTACDADAERFDVLPTDDPAALAEALGDWIARYGSKHGFPVRLRVYIGGEEQKGSTIITSGPEGAREGVSSGGGWGRGGGGGLLAFDVTDPEELAAKMDMAAQLLRPFMKSWHEEKAAAYGAAIARAEAEEDVEED
jgi:hypothetical protein